MSRTDAIIRATDAFGARNYAPLPVVVSRAEGVWVEDPEGNRYLDMLSAYSALNQGHRHPKIVQALKDQADRVTLTSRAFHHERLADLYQLLHELTGKSRFLPMNSGAEAVESAIKLARRWACDVKRIPGVKPEIIICAGNFHGRTVTATSLSTSSEYRRGFGPFTPGFVVVPYGDAGALEQAITPNTAAFLVEPIQGEAGIIIPPEGYLAEAAAVCRKHRVLFMADEIQTGFGRTGTMFACDREGVVPDVYILGKALGGGVFPVSAVAADDAVMAVLEPGSHGSTFGGNPLACAVAQASLEVIRDERLPERSDRLGSYLLNRLKERLADAGSVKQIRGRGLFVGIELDGPARPACELLLGSGVLCKETHERVIRLAPPLTITQAELDWAMDRVVPAILEYSAK